MRKSILLAMVICGWCAPGHAEDWQLQRKPPKVAARTVDSVDKLRLIVERNPADGYALRRLMQLVQKEPAGLASLISEYERRAAEQPNNANWPMLVGYLQAAAGAQDKAVAAFEQAAGRDPRAAEASRMAGEVARRIKQFPRALAAFEQALQRTTDRERQKDLLRQLVDVALEAGREEDAQGYYRRWAALEPQNIFVAMDYAAALARNRREAAALSVWQDVAQRSHGDLKMAAVAARERGALLESLGRLDEALAAYREVLARVGPAHWAYRDLLDRVIDLYRRQDRLSEIVAEIEKRGRLDYEAIRLLGRLYEELGDDSKALSFLQKAVHQRARDLSAHEDLIRLLTRFGKDLEVLGELQKLNRLAPSESRYVLRLAEHLVRIARPSEGFDLLEKASRRFAADPSVHAAIIDFYLRYGAPRERVEYEYRQLIRLEPREETHVVNLGEYYYSEHRTAEAIATWRKILQMQADTGAAWLSLAEIFRDHDLIKEADEAYAQAVQKKPEDAKIRRSLAAFWQRQKKFKEAEQQWRALLERLPADRRRDRQEARANVIGCLEARGALQGAVEDLRKDAQAHGTDVDRALLLAEALLRLRDGDAALSVYEGILQREPDHIETLLALETAYVRAGQLEQATALLERLVRLDPPAARTLLRRLSDYSLQLNRPEQALKYAKAAVEQDQNDPDAQVALGDLLLRLGRPLEAVAALEAAQNLGSASTAAEFRLADLYRDIGDAANESRLLAHIVENVRDSSEVLRAGRRLIRLDGGRGRLEEVERVLLPLALAKAKNGMYRKLLIEFYEFALNSGKSRLDVAPAAALAASRKLVERGLKPLLDALDDEDTAVRAQAIDILQELHAASAVLPLIRLLDGKDSLLRFRAAVALGYIASPKAVAALDRLLTDRSKQLSLAALWSLGFIRSAEALPPLVSVVSKNAADPRSRALACMALGIRGLTDGSEVLVAALRAPQAQVRVAAALALGMIPGPAAVRTLASRLLGEPPEIRRAFLWALSRNATTEVVLPIMASLFAPGDPELRELSARALLRAFDIVPPGSPAAAEAELDLLRERYRSFVNLRDAEVALFRVAPPNILIQRPSVEQIERFLTLAQAALRQALAQTLANPDAQLQEQLLSALTQHPTLLTLDPLVGRDQVHLPAAGAIRRMLGEAVSGLRPRLLQLLATGAQEVRAGVLGVLGRLGAAEDEPSIIAALADPDLDVRRAATAALALMPSAEAHVRLRELATSKDLDWQQALAACTALRADPDPAAAKTLAELAMSSYASVWRCAIAGLGRCKDAASASFLAELLLQPPIERAALAAQVLKAQDTAQARNLLKRLPATLPTAVLRAAQGQDSLIPIPAP